MSGELHDELTKVAELVEEIAARKAAGSLTQHDEQFMRAQAALRLERAVVLCVRSFANSSRQHP